MIRKSASPGMYLITLLAVLLCSRLQAQVYNKNPSHYWIDLPAKGGAYTQEVFDDQVLQMMAATGKYIILHTTVIDSNNYFFNMDSIIMRAHATAAPAGQPGLKVLMYSHVLSADTSVADYIANSNFMPFHMMSGYLHQNVVQSRSGGDYHDLNGSIVGDLVEGDTFANWMVPLLVDTMRRYNFDGVFSDVFHAASHVALPGICSAIDTPTGADIPFYGIDYCDRYYDSVMRFIARLKDSLGTGPFLFNGLSSKNDSDIIQQIRAADAANGSTIEYFGYAKFKVPADTAFADQVLPFVQQMAEHPNTHIFACGKADTGTYIGYDRDYGLQRYTYASYLLGKTDSSGFHFFADYALGGLGGRPTPLDYYEDMAADSLLGPVTGLDTYQVASGVYFRYYPKGVVAVYPREATGTASFTFSNPLLPVGAVYYTFDSTHAMNNTVTLHPGQGIIAFTNASGAGPDPWHGHPVVLRDFEDNGAIPTPTKSWQYASIKQYSSDTSQHYDSLGGLGVPNRHLHDLMLDWNRSTSNWGTMQFKVRGANAASRIYVIADVDDTHDSLMQVVFADTLGSPVRPTNALKAVEDSLLFFRRQKNSAGPDIKKTKFIPMNLSISQLYNAGWTTAGINGQALIDSIGLGSRLKFKRFVFMRVTNGGIDIDSVMLPYMGKVTVTPATAAICTGGSTTFTATAGFGSGPYTYSWSPATGLSSATVATVTASPAAGVYNYTVTVTDARGLSGTATVSLTVNAPVAVTASATGLICAGGTTSLTSVVTGGITPYTYSWAGSGVSATSMQNTTATPSGTGIKIYTLTVTSTPASGCNSASDTAVVTVNPDLSVAASATGLICAGGTAGLTSIVTGGITPYTYSWAGAGVGTTSIQNTTATPTGTGIKIYTLTVTSTTASGCNSTSDTAVVTVNPDLSVAASATGLICTGGTTSLTSVVSGGITPYTYSWAGAGITVSSLQNTSAMPTGTGTATYTLTVTSPGSGCGNATDTAVTTVNADISVTASAIGLICNGGTTNLTSVASGGITPYSYSWSGAGVVSPTLQNTTATPTTTGVNVYTLSVASAPASGCTSALDTAVVTVNSQPSLSVAATPAEICVNGTLTLTTSVSGGAGTATYGWSGTGITTVTGSSTPPGTVMPSVAATPASFTVTYATSAPGCNQASAMTTANVDDPLSVSVSNSGQSCSGGTVTLSAVASGGSGSYTYSWSGTSLLSSTGSSVAANPAVGDYVYTVTTSTTGGCGSVSDTLQLSVALRPGIAFTATPTSICLGGTTTITTATIGGAGTKTYMWAGPGIATVTGSPTPPASFSPSVISTPGTYSVGVTYSGAGCGRAIATHTVNVHSCARSGELEAIATNTRACPQCAIVLNCSVTGGNGNYHYQWMGDEGTGALQNDQSAAASAIPVAGQHFYTVAVWDDEGRRASATTEVVMSPGAFYPISWDVYPNPAKDKCNISLSTAENESIDVVLSDVAGRALKTRKLVVNGNEIIAIPVPDLAPGAYLISLYKNGNIYATKKVIISR